LAACPRSVAAMDDDAYLITVLLAWLTDGEDDRP
jgi:hypothetical protein